VRYAFLVLREHPYGQEMLRRLVAAGRIPACVVEEDSAVADVEREKFRARTAGYDPGATITELCTGHAIALHAVAKHDSAHCLPLLADLDLDLLVLGGTRIVRGALLDLPRHGVVNSHPGLLPDCRGSASPAWSVYHDLPLGATTHLCDARIDTGDVLLRREIAVHRGDTYEDLCTRTMVLASTLMVEALEAFERGAWELLRTPQGASDRPTFRNAPDEVLAEVRRKLRDQTYRHYTDS
jgi:methionyl-tRNA formyltransferase